jgi:ribosomal protein L25 (general stress protein Ctc)
MEAQEDKQTALCYGRQQSSVQVVIRETAMIKMTLTGAETLLA